LLGLGTGSLAWTYHYLLPHAELTALELRPAVIEAARERLRLNELTQLKVIEGDALTSISMLPERSQTLMAIDLFTDQGMAEVLHKAELWRQVSRVLHPSGALCLNAWSGQIELLRSLVNDIERWVCPGGLQVGVSHPGFGNVTVFVTPRPYQWSDILQRAQKVDVMLAQRRVWTRGQTREMRRVGLTQEGVVERLSRAEPMKKLIL
jgi:spermidine synthase